MRKLTEDDEQAALIQWFDTQYPELKGRLYAIPNGGKRHITTAVRLKRTGSRKGIPDLCLPVPSLDFHGLYIELKIKGGRLTTEQADWLHFLGEQGYMAMMCVGFESAKNTINEYLCKVKQI